MCIISEMSTDKGLHHDPLPLGHNEPLCGTPMGDIQGRAYRYRGKSFLVKTESYSFSQTKSHTAIRTLVGALFVS